jgi:hypothetical protein
MKALLLVASAFVLWNGVANAQTEPTFEPILLPLALRPAHPGTGGALWVTELTLRNDSTARVRFEPTVCGPVECPDIRLEPGTTVLNPLTSYAAPDERTPPGRMLYLERPGADLVSLGLVLKDLSQTSPWGTQIPVVREREFYSTTIQLLNVPIDPLVRQTLRIYDVDAKNATFTVRLYDLETDAPLGEEIVRASGGYIGDVPEIPSYAQLDRLSDRFPGTHSATRVRIEITPNEPARFWAFASVTHNVTQHVTLVVPE